MADRNEKTLTLLHLRKTFSEYLKIPLGGSRDLDPARLLPLFAKVMAMYSPCELRVDFKEIVQFASYLSSVLVREVRGRAASEGTEQAAADIAAYLQPSGEPTAAAPKGWLTLTAIHYLISTDDSEVVEGACKSSLPSTLVKAIYLFLDLPLPLQPAEEQQREKLNQLLTSLMDRLSQFKSVGEELARKDDLVLLFAGSSSHVLPHNVCWRKTAALTLEALAARALTHTVVKYICTKECIPTYITNMSSAKMSSQETAEMVIGILAVLKDSGRTTNALLEEFAIHNGYLVIKEFLLKNAVDEELVRNVLVMLVAVVTSGVTELRPQASSGLVSLAHFHLPVPIGNGLSVRNTHPFGLLFALYLESSNPAQCCSVCDVVHSVYTCDPANYFILDREFPLSQFIEQMDRKPPQVQAKVFELIEFVIFQLAHIPCKELISVCVLMKTELSAGRVDFLIQAVQSAFRILTVDPLVKDAFREVGLLDTLSYVVFHLFSVYKERPLKDAEKKLTLLATDLLTVIIKGNPENAKMLCECAGGCRPLLDLLTGCSGEWRSSALQLLKQLLLLAPTDAYIAGLLNAMAFTAPQQQLELDTDLLKCLLGVLRESHKVRVLFRRAGGYLSLIQLLLGMEGAFSQLEQMTDTVPAEQTQLLDFIHLIFKVLTISMRFEPSNAKYFFDNVSWDSITTVLRLTGAFSERTQVDVSCAEWKAQPAELREQLVACHAVFKMDENIQLGSIPAGMPPSIFFSSYIIRLLFNMALDNYEKLTSDVCWAAAEGSLEEGIVSWTSSVLVHPGAVLSILALLPSIHARDERWTVVAQFYCSLLLKALLKPERNQQMMCQVEMPRALLSISPALFLSEQHLLLPSFHYLLERLSYQAMQPRELREFLRLDRPLCCRNLDAEEGEEPLTQHEGGPVPVGRVKALVSMMTPRDQRLSHAPSFVELDMAMEGFGCLFIPSLAPVFSANRSERVFPPLNGLTFSCWVLVEELSDKKVDAHPLRLLTLSRAVSFADRKGQPPSHIACFTVQMSPIDRSLLISTEEHENPGADIEKDAKFPSEKVIRVPLNDVVRELEWTHVCVVLTRSIMKSSQACVYVNGSVVSSQRLSYVVHNAGGAATQLATTHAVNACIGTPPSMRRPSRLRFRIASTFMMDEPLSAETVRALHNLQPHYVGGLQTAGPDGTPLVAEEKVVFGLAGCSTDELTLSRIRQMHSKMDAEMLAPHLGISPHDNSTPLRILCNTASHAPGPGRAFGAVIVGYLGMRTFAPRPVPRLLDSMGGYTSLFALVAMATDSEGLYASLKAVVSAVRSNAALAASMHANRAYQTLAVLLEDKARLLNSHIMHLVFCLVGTLDTSRERLCIPSQQAFDDLLCDLDVWKEAPDELHRMMLEHFHELITDQQRETLRSVRISPLPSRFLFQLFEQPQRVLAASDVVFNLIAAIVQPPSDNRSMLKLGQAVAATLPSTEEALAAEDSLPFHISELHAALTAEGGADKLPSPLYMVYVRNRILNLLANLLSHSSPQLNGQMSEQIVRVLGFDWILALMSPGIHSGTVFLSLRLLLSLLSHAGLLHKFREGSGNGGWLADADSVVRNRAAVVLGFSVSSSSGSVGAPIDINPELANCCGFAALEHIMAHHAHRPHCYIAMLSLLVGQPVKDLRLVEAFDVDMVWTHVFGLASSSSVYGAIQAAEFCMDALLPLLAMIRTAIHSEGLPSPSASAPAGWHTAYPCAVLQMLSFFYQNSPTFFVAAHSDEFIHALFGALIPDPPVGERPQSAGSPDSERAREVLSSPAARAVLELLKRVMCDDVMVNTGARASDSLVDGIVENISENSSVRKAQSAALTHLVHLMLEHLVGTDLLVSSSLPASLPPQSTAAVGQAVFTLAQRVVDGLWNGLVRDDPMRVLHALYNIHAIASRKENRAMSPEPLVHAIMRCVLFILSRPIDSVTVQMCVLDALASVVTKKVVFLSSNEPWFFACLSHLIFMLSVTPDILSSKQHDPLERASAQVAMCASRVWSDVLCAKKALLEEAFKKNTVCELNAARALLAACAGQHWHAFVDQQLAGVGGVPGQGQAGNVAGHIGQHISSKITRVASGLSRFAAKRSLSTVGSISVAAPWKHSSVTNEVVMMWLKVHVSLLKELVATQAQRYHEWHAHVRKWSLHEWEEAEAELTRERGIWGPEKASVLDKYRLDTTEGPARIRRKMVPNRHFYHHYPYRPHLDNPNAKALRAKVAISRDSALYWTAMAARRRRTLDSRILDQSENVRTPAGDDALPRIVADLDQLNSSLIRRLSIKPAGSSGQENGDEIEEEEEEERDVVEVEEKGDGEEKETSPDDERSETSGSTDTEKGEGKREEKEEEGREEADRRKRGPDNQTLLRLLEQGEQLHSMFRTARIQGLEVAEGLLLFGREHFYVVDGFTLLKTREIRDLDFLPPELHDPIVPYTATGASRPPRASRLCSKFSYDDIREVHRRRYLLQPIAIEVFSSDGRNYLLAFPKKMRDRVYDKLMSMARGLTAGGSESVGGQRANMNIEQSGRASLINSIIGQQSVTQRWLSGQLSNFQYLMHINTLAGRSYNDLSQYPVFPWVLSDYSSPVLDFTKRETFRDLSKPMGAQSSDRLEQFLKRYREWDDPTGDTPPYMYGTHYSSAMIVVSYLVRLEPFTQQFLNLQGGHFDLADRMFHSVGDAWVSASKNNMADVKELIPEFFSLPEMFTNGNRFDLGVKQNGVALDDVLLPPWANGDPREFVRLHRQALESDYVSSHLHEWIDLVFGYKQNGEGAVQAHNLFHHLFYEGSVDFEQIDDPLTRNATIGFVNNFGQIPSQLFKKPHPQKKVSPVDGYSNTPGVTTARLFYHSLHSLKPPHMPVKELRSAVGSLFHSERTGLIALEQNKVLLEGRGGGGGGASKYLAWGLPDSSIRLGQVDSDKSMCVYEMSDWGELTCAAAGDERTLFCGSSTGSVSVWSVQRRAPRLSLRTLLDGHSDAVTCIAVCAAHAFIVTASRDHSVIVWHQSELSLIRQLNTHPQPVSAVAVNHTTGDIATACGSSLFVWSINGQLLSCVNTCDATPADPNQMILAIAFSTLNEWDSDNVIMCGTADGVVKIYSGVLVENDGSVTDEGVPIVQRDVEKSPGGASTVQARLERQRRRLKVGGSSLASHDGSEASNTPEPPASPAMHASNTSQTSMESASLEASLPAESREATGHVRVLVQRAALTMHTAFNRPDNTHPAPITAILPSKDHQRVWVGDGVGRVWQWEAGVADGGRADHWVLDVARQRCASCQHRFSIADRKHHCRNCGHIFCAKCSRFESHITHMKISRPVRVCQNCFLRLKAQTPS